jgi:hypothetical protein
VATNAYRLFGTMKGSGRHNVSPVVGVRDLISWRRYSSIWLDGGGVSGSSPPTCWVLLRANLNSTMLTISSGFIKDCGDIFACSSALFQQRNSPKNGGGEENADSVTAGVVGGSPLARHILK